MSNKYVYFSNTIGEFELFSKNNYFYWPRNVAKSTEYQRDNNIDLEAESLQDIVYIVTGSKIKNNVKGENLENKITKSPMLTYQGIVEEIYEHPVICYKFILEAYKDYKQPRNHIYFLPLETLEDLNNLETYLGKKLTSEDKNELETAIKLKKIIFDLNNRNELNFARAYFNNNKDKTYIENEDKYFSLDPFLKETDILPSDVLPKQTERKMLDKQSFEKILSRMKDEKISDPKKYLSKLSTWKGEEFLKVQLKKEFFKKIPFTEELARGISTRMMLEQDNSRGVFKGIRKITGNKNDKGEEENMTSKKNYKKVPDIYNKNTILYGPPGTGKTYSTVKYALGIIRGKEISEIEKEYDFNYKDMMEDFKEYKSKGQVEFTTFHQSFGYEDFIEGIRPVINEEDNEVLEYKIESGVFKEFCDQAKKTEISSKDNNLLNENPTVWKISLGARQSKTNVKKECFNDGFIRIGWDSQPEYYSEDNDYSIEEHSISVLKDFEFAIDKGDIVLSLYDQKHIDAIGIVIGDYKFDDSLSKFKRKRKVEWIIKNEKIPVYELNGQTNLTLRTLYELWRIKSDDILDIVEDKKTGKEDIDIKENEKNYVFIIDEINRGNISKIFGELITLIESNKRVGEDEETKATLPYSKIKFGVPNNIYIIGTMNTADRSIALIDTALRRRFTFYEMMPDVKKLDEINNGNPIIINDINISEMLKTLNKRIEYLYDREHTIGHSYFISLIENNSIEHLGKIFKYQIIPLLQEYFYDDYNKIRLILADKNTDQEEYQFLNAEKVERKLFNKNLDMYNDEKLYKINEDAFDEPKAYMKIYKDIENDKNEAN